MNHKLLSFRDIIIVADTQSDIETSTDNRGRLKRVAREPVDRLHLRDDT